MQNEDYEDEPDESLSERLWGLTEMFPEPVRHLTETVVDLSGKSVVNLYKFACASSWIFFTSSMILFAPSEQSVSWIATVYSWHVLFSLLSSYIRNWASSDGGNAKITTKTSAARTRIKHAADPSPAIERNQTNLWLMKGLENI
jgi:hypothetical protein